MNDLRSHLAECGTFHHLVNCTSSLLFWNNRQSLQLNPFLGLKDSGSSPKQDYQGKFATKAVSMQVHLQASPEELYFLSLHVFLQSMVLILQVVERILSGLKQRFICQ